MINTSADNSTTKTIDINNNAIQQRITALERELTYQRDINAKLLDALKKQHYMICSYNDDIAFLHRGLLTTVDHITKNSSDGYAFWRLHDELRKRV